ncbi:MAG: tyrosine recombinase XerC [Hyphomicrobiaceae bacterium]
MIFLVRSLGKVSLAEANRARDRIWQEVERLEDELASKSVTAERDYEASIIAELQSLAGTPESDQMKIVLLDQAETMQANGKDGLGFFKRVTGKQHRLIHFVDQWDASKRVVPTTQLSRRFAVDRFAGWAGDTAHVETVTRRQAGEYVHHLQGKGLAPRTVNSQVSYLSAYWKFMMNRGIVDANPWQGQQVTADKVIEREPWEPREIIDLIDHAPSSDLRDAIAISALSGLRSGEVVNLKVGDCTSGVLSVRKGKTPAATRKVPVHSQLAVTIARLVVGREANDWLLAEFNGNRKLLVNKFTRYRKQRYGSGVERQATKVFHSLRSYWVDSRLKVDVDLRLVQELAGHVPQGVTQKHYYTGMTLEQARQVVEAVQLPISSAE